MRDDVAMEEQNDDKDDGNDNDDDNGKEDNIDDESEHEEEHNDLSKYFIYSKTHPLIIIRLCDIKGFLMISWSV